MTARLVTAPSELPVTLSEAKRHLRVMHDDEDLLIESLISAATSHIDGINGVMGRCIISQEWAVSFDRLQGDVVLPFPDVTAAAVSYIDAAGDTQTVPSADYRVYLASGRSVLGLVSGARWPQAITGSREAFTVTFTAGFGSAIDVPWSIKAAILMLIGQWYEHRETVGEGKLLPLSFHALISPYRCGVV